MVSGGRRNINLHAYAVLTRAVAFFLFAEKAKRKYDLCRDGIYDSIMEVIMLF